MRRRVLRRAPPRPIGPGPNGIDFSRPDIQLGLFEMRTHIYLSLPLQNRSEYVVSARSPPIKENEKEGGKKRDRSMQPFAFVTLLNRLPMLTRLADGLPHPTLRGIEHNRERSGDEDQAPWLCPN